MTQPNRARSAPLTVANLPIMSKAYYAKQAFDETSMEPPLGSGAYKVASSSRAASSSTSASRIGGARPADQPRPEQFRYAALRILSRSRNRLRRLHRQELPLPRGVHVARWATRYDFPAIKDGRVKRESIPDKTPSGAQAGSSTRDARSSRTCGCARLSTPSTSNGPTRTSCTAPMRARIPVSRTPT